MSANQADHAVATMCRLLGVSTSGFYAWQARRPSARQESDAALLKCIREVHRASDGTYGAPRVHAELVAEGISVGHNRVARLMREAGLVGVSRRKRPGTTQRRNGARPAPDLVERKFTADAPDRLWLADITYLPTWTGFLYLAVVLDAFSRRVVGWAMASHLRTQLGSTRSTWRCSNAGRATSSIIPTRARNTLRSPSACAAGRQACDHQWGRSVTATIMRCARASLPRSNAS